MVPRTIWLLWLQGWERAPWLQRQVLESWQINNPGWDVVLLTVHNLNEYIPAKDAAWKYMGDNTKTMSNQARSDIIRLALLANHGGVWADATMLCMQPLDNWVDDAVTSSGGFWMYHGHGDDMKLGPASWFMASEKGHVIPRKWKAACDAYWSPPIRTRAHKYFWMDSLFRQLDESDTEFSAAWLSVKFLYCENPGQAHCLSYGKWAKDDPTLKDMLEKEPPYALKLNNFVDGWDVIFPDTSTPECRRSNGYHAIQMALRGAPNIPIHLHPMLTKTDIVVLD